MKACSYSILAVAAALLMLSGCGGSGGGSSHKSFAFVGDRQQSLIYAYTLNANGTLQFQDQFATAESVKALVATPDGHRLYALTQDGVQVFSVSHDGSLTVVNETPVAVPSETYGLMVTPDDKYLFVTSANDEVYQFVLDEDGNLTPNSSPNVETDTNPVQIVLSPDGEHVYVANEGGSSISCFTLQADGKLTGGTQVETPAGPWSMTMSDDGTELYVGCHSANKVAQFSVAPDGTLTTIGAGSVDGPNNCYSVALSSATSYLFSASYSAPHEIKFYTIAEDGHLTPSVSTGETNEPSQWPIVVHGNVLYVCNQDDGTVGMYEIEEDGLGNSLGQEGPGVEPASIAFIDR